MKEQIDECLIVLKREEIESIISTLSSLKVQVIQLENLLRKGRMDGIKKI